MDKRYQTVLHQTLLLIEQTKEKLINRVFDLAITGGLKDWAHTIEEGEDFYFNKELFESLDDRNVKYLISIINSMEMPL